MRTSSGKSGDGIDRRRSACRAISNRIRQGQIRQRGGVTFAFAATNAPGSCYRVSHRPWRRAQGAMSSVAYLSRGNALQGSRDCPVATRSPWSVGALRIEGARRSVTICPCQSAQCARFRRHRRPCNPISASCRAVPGERRSICRAFCEACCWTVLILASRS